MKLAGTALTTWQPNHVIWQSMLPTVRAEGEGTPPAAPAVPPVVPPTGSTSAPTFTQEDVDRLITQRLEREARKREADTRKAADEAEAKRLADQQAFKQLADKHEARVKELEPSVTSLTTERDVYRTHIEAEINAAIKDWPKSFQALVPANDNAMARLAAYQTAKAALDDLGGTPPTAPRVPGTPIRQPRPAGDDRTPAQAELDSKRQSARYRVF